ncbi:MAG: adenylate/guanylate cyclase domain-containing protein [Bacteroidales bacterium]|jgi:class 3 adenylate cyclase|nr:adenylate/guanylate cyclase domain-containing protein [Bacteroidales bacterium]MDD3700580.1 adenylate/guanylate cyclase domain-containing protein [Bacteroidales bacterium]MDY0368296.1 adenylate/guanylate cyclase domain-containing protein [Bacteroidales bacterium]
MSLKQEITDKVKAIMDEEFKIEDVTYVPDIKNSKLTFGNTGLKFEATVLYIDMRGSTEILNKHNKASVAKMHMAYFHTIVKIAKALGGEVRSFNGDSMLVFFQGTTKLSLSNAVQAAMQMRYMLASTDSGINKYLAQYSALNFGVGLDDGDILCTKIGVGGDSNNQDLMWIGNCVNKSTAISDKCSSPNFIGISKYVYDNLLDWAKFGTRKNYWGQDEKVDMWTQGYFNYNNKSEYYYYTSWEWKVD